jgi:hypothetical protein
VGVGPTDACAPARLGLGELDVEYEPPGRASGEEVLDRLGALATGARRAHLRVEDEQRGLEVAPRRLGPRRRAQIAAQRGLSADLEVRQAAGAGAQRLDGVLELGDRRRRADRRAPALAAHARQAGAADEQGSAWPQAAVGDLGHDDRPACDDGDVRPIAESAHRLLTRRRDDHFRRLNDPHDALSLRRQRLDEGPYT